MISFAKYIMEMNIPGTHLDGNKDGTGSLITSDQSGSEQPDGGGRIPFLPSTDLVLQKLDQKLPEVLKSISTNFEDTDTHVPVHPSLEYLAKISPKATFTGRVTYTNGIPTQHEQNNGELPKNHIYITFADDQSGRPINLIMTKPQYSLFKDMNNGKNVALGMKIEVCMQRMTNDHRATLPWGSGKNKTTPNLSNILGVRYGY